MSSKIKRKVTVENSSNDASDSSRRQSVFERLGPGAVPISTQSQDRHNRATESGEKCRNWLRTGTCSYGSSCRYQHEPYSSNSTRQRKADKEIDEKDLRYKVRSKRKDMKETKTNVSPSPKKSSQKHAENRTSRKEQHESKLGLKSTVVITRPRTPASEGDEAQQRDPAWEEDSDEWPMDASQLDYKEELTLEMKRQQLQKELEIELQKERMMNENVTITKPISVTGSSSSSSSSSRSTSSSTSSSSGSGTVSSSSESSSSEESEGERSSSSVSRSSSSSSTFHKKGGLKASAQSSKVSKKQTKESKHTKLSGHSRHEKSKDKAKQPQSVKSKDSARPHSTTPTTRRQESHTRKRRTKGADSKTLSKGERVLDDRTAGHKQKGPRTPSPTVATHNKQWHGVSAFLEHHDEKRGKGKRHKRRRLQVSKEQETLVKTHPSASLQGTSPTHCSSGGRSRHHRDDSLEKRPSQKNAPKHKGGQSPGRKHYSHSPLPPLPLSLPPKVAADTREHDRAEQRRSAHMNDSTIQSISASRPTKKSRKNQRTSSKASSSKADSRSSNHHARDTSRDKHTNDRSHSNERRGARSVYERGTPMSQQLASETSGKDRHKVSPSRDREHRNDNMNKVSHGSFRNSRTSDELKWPEERGGRKVERGHKEGEERSGQRSAKSSNISGNVQARDQNLKRKHTSSPSWEKEQRAYESAEAVSRYGDQKYSGCSTDEKHSERVREKIKCDPDRDSERSSKRQATSSERQRVSSHSCRESARQSSPPRNSQRSTTNAEKGDYSKNNFKNESHREDNERDDDNQRGVYSDRGRHREQNFSLERPPAGDHAVDSYRDFRYSEADRDHYTSRRDYPHARRGEIEHDQYGPTFMRDEYYQPPSSMAPEEWDHYREYSANHEPLGSMTTMMPTYRGGSRAERPQLDRYRDGEVRGETRISSREEETRSIDRRQRARSPDWTSRRDERIDMPSHQIQPSREQTHTQESTNWERGSRHSSRGSAEGHRSSQRKETHIKRETSAPSSNSSNSSKRDKQKYTSKKDLKDKNKPQKEKEKLPPEKRNSDESKQKSHYKKPPTDRSNQQSSVSESRRDEKKKASNLIGDKLEKKKSTSSEKKKKTQPTFPPSSPISEKGPKKEENDTNVVSVSPLPSVDIASTSVSATPHEPSPVPFENPESPVAHVKETTPKDVSLPESNVISVNEVLHISAIDKDGEVENFSDWSDDDDDELLTRDEPSEDKGKGQKEIKEQPAVSDGISGEVLLPIQDSKHQKQDRSKEDRNSKRYSRSHSRDRRSKDRSREERQEKKENLPRIDEVVDASITKTDITDLKEEEIDYDPISDDELEAMIEDPDDVAKEEGESKTGLIDSLGVDWASLATETRQKSSFKPGNARKRFTAANIIQRVGISVAWAGAELTQKVIDFCEKQLQKDSDEEEKLTDSEPSPKKMCFLLEHPIAAFQVAAIEQKKARSNILQDMGPYRKALCARQDLLIRRQLCKVGIKGVDSLSYSQQQQNVDKDLYKLSLEMFRRRRSDQRTSFQVTCS